jgi:predicted metal-dependent phosphoesterase TrpH
MINDKHNKTNQISENASMGTAVLERQGETTQWQAHQPGKIGRADLHMHSTYSDGSATIEQILDYVEHHTPLDAISITDHDVIEGSLRARALWAKGSYRFDFIVGEEISTKDGHLLALFIEKCIPPDLSMDRSVDLVHEQGGLAIVAHPLHPVFRFSCQREVLDRIYASADLWLDGIETRNAGFSGIYGNRVAMSVNRQVYGWPEVGNSDAHILQSIGCAYTTFEGTSAMDLRNSIEAGLSAPGGKLWGMYDYLRLVSHRINKRLSALQQRVA